MQVMTGMLDVLSTLNFQHELGTLSVQGLNCAVSGQEAYA